ncbi:hypothetical protein SLEP1_g3436 [Rubroshorea leprosula]|uniref:Uncharacterized protein n=1 Tax=Rubroshorea leprosula TaxID=152421 RepID=A0AAV5HPQ2_9ROSI|nr:hypothetical protein SLEP1_g3436 [Rubroshorea leprosula]
MSSEGTVSIIGSEVMPLDYGSMDSKSSPSPSSSEKTVEGVRGDEVIEVGGEEVAEVGGNEVVEVGGDSIPITVVEVEGRGERDYDVNAEIVEEVKQYRSELRTKDSLGHLVENYEISSRVLVRPAGVEKRACSAPRDHWMPIYSHYLIAGLRFPIHELLVDDTEWERGDAEVRELASWKAKKANQNSAQCIEAAELYGPSALSEVEMDQFLNTAGGVAIPKKPRKKSKTLTKQVDEGRARKEVMPATLAETEEEAPQLKRKGWEERRALQKKKKVVKEEERGNELEEGAEVRAPGKGKGPVPPVASQSSLFEPKNMTGARWFINSTFPEVDKRNARDEALRYGGASVVKHVLEKEKEELEKKNKELQESLNEVVPTVKQLEQERASLSTKLVFEESKRRISESERETQAQEIKLMKEAFVELKENVQTLVHNGMKKHISNFISSSSFDNIVNLYWLPTAIIAFTDYKKKAKAEYLEVDITKITFGEQEEGVEEDGESMSADFRPQIKLRWEHDANGRAVFPPQFDFEFVAVEEEGAEVEEDEVEAGVEGAEVDESQPVPEVEIHPVPSDDEQPPLPDEQQPTQIYIYIYI